MQTAAIQEQLKARHALRNSGNYAQADVIRAELEHDGYVIRDTRTGTRWYLADDRNVGGFVKAR